MTADIPRIDVEAARTRTQSGQALLVCAYDDEQKCRSMLLEDAITLGEFEARRGDLAPDQDIILYCA